MAACTAVYAGSFKVPFVFDDLYRIVNNPEIRNLENFFRWSVFTEQRPLVDLTFALNYWFGGLELRGHHLVNVLIHMANSVLVYLLSFVVFQRLSLPGSRFSIPYPAAMALLAALVFCVHPLQTQAVTYIAQRYTSLAAFFYLLSVLCYVLGRVKQLPDRNMTTAVSNIAPGLLFALCFVFGLAAFLSKQNAISLPLAILLMEFVLFDRTWAGWKRKLKWIIPAGAVFIVFVLISAGLLKGDLAFGKLLEDISALSRETDSAGRFQYLVTQFAVLLVYLRLLVWPASQSLDYMYPFVEGFSWLSLAGFGVLLGLITLAVLSLRRFPLVTLGVFWVLITLSVESSVIPITDALVEHRLYLPMAGFAWLIVFVMAFVLRRPAVVLPVSAVLVLALSVATIERNKIWKSNFSLWADVVKTHPDNHRARFNLGNALREKKRLEEAERQYIAALDLRDDYPQAHYNLGLTYLDQGMPEEALRHFQAAIEARPGYVQAVVNKASVLAGIGRVEEAFAALYQAHDMHPDHPVINYNLGYLHFVSQEPARAEQYLIKARDAGHRIVDAAFILGNIYFEHDRINEAREQYYLVLEHQPEHAGAWFNLGNAYIKAGDLQEAALKYEQALTFDPGFARGHYVLSRVLLALDMEDQAVHHLIRANELEPDFLEARQELIRILQSE